MKYFIAYVTFKEGCTIEWLLKSKSAKFLEEQIQRYPKGMINSSDQTIMTEHVDSIFLQEVTDFRQYSKSDFSIINELRSYNDSELIEE